MSFNNRRSSFGAKRSIFDGCRKRQRDLLQPTLTAEHHQVNQVAGRLLRPNLYANRARQVESKTKSAHPSECALLSERATGFEPVTFSLARRRSTPEPRPHGSTVR